MSIRCRILGHMPNGPGVYNEGLYFSRCDRCGVDLFRQKVGNWSPLPRQLRVKWDTKGSHSVTPWRAANWTRGRRD